MEKNLKIFRGRLTRPRLWRKPHVLATCMIVEGEGEAWSFRAVRHEWQLTVTPEGHLGHQESKEIVLMSTNGFDSEYEARWAAERLALAMDLDVEWTEKSPKNLTKS